MIVALDPDAGALRMARAHSGAVVFSHHPPPEGYKGHVPVVAAHTNADFAPGGLADLICERIGFASTRLLRARGRGAGRIVDFRPSVLLARIAALVRRAYPNCDLRIGGAQKTRIRRLAICPGSGGSLIQDVARAGADAYLTGDIKYHMYRDAEELGFAILDAGHFDLEIGFVDRAADLLAAAGPDLQIRKYHAPPPFR